MCISAKLLQNLRSRECNSLIASPQAELSIPDRIPARGEWKCLCASPLAGTMNRNKYKISACGDVKFWLHSRKVNCRFWIAFPRGGNENFYVHLRSRGPWTKINTKSPLAGIIAFPQAELSILDRIPARGEWKFLCASPLAGTVNRNKYKISACGDVEFWLHSRKRNCQFWIVFPRGGNVNIYVHLREVVLRSRECNILIASPQAELSIPDRIPRGGGWKLLCASPQTGPWTEINFREYVKFGAISGGNFVKIWYFVNNWLMFESKFLLHVGLCDT